MADLVSLARTPRPGGSPAATALGCLLFAASAARVAAGAVSPPTDPKAAAVAERVMQALGGEAAWNATRYLRFDFAVDRGGKTLMRRAHTWDKWTGRYRVEGMDKDGREVVIVMNINTREGSATVGGAPVAAAQLNKMLETGYAWWVNDTYWLLMPYKMRDAGVILAYAGQDKKGAEAWDKVQLSFDGVGLTPKDRYWAYVNAKTGLVDRWEFVLNGEKTAPTPFEWKGWKTYGSIRLADERVSPKDGTRIFFPVLDTPTSVPDDTFAPATRKP